MANTLTARDMQRAINQRVLVRFESMAFDCTVLDVKSAYGRERLLVEPILGTGQQWIELARVIKSYPEYVNTVDALMPLPKVVATV